MKAASLQNHGLRRGLPRGLLLRGREYARDPPGRMHRLQCLTRFDFPVPAENRSAV